MVAHDEVALVDAIRETISDHTMLIQYVTKCRRYFHPTEDFK
jgi:hypothetical protein